MPRCILDTDSMLALDKNDDFFMVHRNYLIYVTVPFAVFLIPTLHKIGPYKVLGIYRMPGEQLTALIKSTTTMWNYVTFIFSYK